LQRNTEYGKDGLEIVGAIECESMEIIQMCLSVACKLNENFKKALNRCTEQRGEHHTIIIQLQGGQNEDFVLYLNNQNGIWQRPWFP
jgi:hypothetical protein